jgi:uncharacterized protein (DUF1800 family)/uncharacterized protein YjdB
MGNLEVQYRMQQAVVRSSLLLSFAAAQVLAQTITVTVSPSTHGLRVGQTKTFSASVSNTTNKAVTWSVNGIAGGNTTVGTITSSGTYVAPAVVPTPNAVRVRATSVAATTSFGESEVSVLNPEPRITAVTPNMVNVGTFSFVVTGSGFVQGSRILLGEMAIQTTFVSATELKGTATDNTPRETHIVVSNPNPGAANSSAKYFKIMPPVTLSVSPEKTTLRIGTTKQFYAYVSNAADRTVTWHVNNIKGGNATVGTISETGLYTPPAVLPGSIATTWGAATVDSSTTNAPQVTVKAVSVQNPGVSDTGVVTLLNPIPQISSATPTSLKPGAEAVVTIFGTGFASGAQVLLGSSPLMITSFSPTRITGVGKAQASVGGVTTLSVRNPDPGAANSNSIVTPVATDRAVMTAQAAARFLQRAAWGPSPDSIVRLQEGGVENYLREQFTAPMSTYPEPIAESSSITPAQRAFYLNAMTGQDQLRQRVAFALSQILVVSGVKTGSSHQLVPYMRLLHQNAFGNYFTLLKEVTLNPTMGRFLDMVNNQKANPARNIEPNENYARELLQLMSIGLVELNMDGSPRRDAFGNTIPTYTEDTVKQFSRALTGWTYPTRPGEAPRFPNPSYYNGRMIPFEQYHDTTQKTLLMGEIVPPGRTASEDVDAVINNISRHPNVPPFVALRLIQRLVMGNPSPGYIQRVATAFQGSRGDLWQTVRAVLLDPEADTPAANQGKLREPVLFVLSLLRGLNATVGIEHPLNSQANNMGQNLWFAPSVFNYFSPFFRVNGIVSPEFQITTPSVSLNRVNFVYRATRNSLSSSVQIDAAHFERLAENPAVLIEALNQALLAGSMSAEMRASILTALTATNDLRTRARNGLYLAGSASQYQVEP